MTRSRATASSLDWAENAYHAECLYCVLPEHVVIGDSLTGDPQAERRPRRRSRFLRPGDLRAGGIHPARFAASPGAALRWRGVSHRIEAAKSGRSKCVTCERVIARGDVRLGELYQDEAVPKPIHRYHHLECAIAAIPDIVRQAMPYQIEGGLGLDLTALEARLAISIDGHRQVRREQYLAQLAVAEPAAEPGEADQLEGDLVRQLGDDPDDTGVLAVLADLWQSRGEPRGELIAVQLALRAAPADPAPLVTRRDELLTRLLPVIEPGERCAWGIGFVRRVELVAKTGSRLAELGALWREPSMRVVAEVRLELATACDGAALAAALRPVAARLRRFELVGTDQRYATASELVAAMPRLRHLTTTDRADHERLAHPALASLELIAVSAAVQDVVPRLSLQALPAVVRLALRRSHHQTDQVCVHLAETGWLHRLTHLDLIDGTLGARGIAALADGLRGQKLARLDVTGNAMPMTVRASLAALCDELVFPNQLDPEGPVWVEHLTRPEWGRGTLVRRYEGKLEVKFPKIGVKVFKADAPFLKLG